MLITLVTASFATQLCWLGFVEFLATL